MQGDAEVAVTLERWAIVATLGVEGGASSTGIAMTPLLRRHYGLFKLNETTAVRAGKFTIAYGIHSPEHRLEMRSGLGWDQGSETYNVELSLLGETVDAFATVQLGRSDSTKYSLERALAFRSSLSLAEKYKVGASIFFGTFQNRIVLGPYAILGFTPRWTLLAELDFERTSEVKAYGYSKLIYGFSHGLDLYVIGELGGLTDSLRKSAGLGISLYPRPHFELVGQVSRGFSREEWLGWVQIHAYL